MRRIPSFPCLVASALGLSGMALPGLADGVPPAAERPGPTLQIPGLPAVPLPPGTRVFGPGGPDMGQAPSTRAQARPTPEAPSRGAQGFSSRPGEPGKGDAAKAEPAKPDAPRADASQPAGRQKILDELFQRLERTKDRAEARGISGAIERVWMRSGSDTADLLMERVSTAMTGKEWPLAEDLLDRIVDLDPQWAEAWNKRATVRFFKDDFSGSMEDLAHVLKLEPRHYTALVGMGVILEKGEQNKAALRVFRKALDINPQLGDIRKKVDKLTIEVDGRDI